MLDPVLKEDMGTVPFFLVCSMISSLYFQHVLGGMSVLLIGIELRDIQNGMIVLFSFGNDRLFLC